MKPHLLAIAALLRAGHCHAALARDASGCIVDPCSDAAVSWCIVGAAMRVCGGLHEAVPVLLAIRAALGLPWEGAYTGGIGPLNDRMTGEEAARAVEGAGG